MAASRRVLMAALIIVRTASALGRSFRSIRALPCNLRPQAATAIAGVVAEHVGAVAATQRSGVRDEGARRERCAVACARLRARADLQYWYVSAKKFIDAFAS